MLVAATIPLADVWIQSFSGGTLRVLLVFLALAGLATCFLGCVLFRLEVTLLALAGGVAAGTALLEWRFASPSGTDYFIACALSALLAGLFGWMFCRLAFAVEVGFLIAAAAVELIRSYLSPAGSFWPWALGIILGLGPAVLAFRRIRTTFVLLSSSVGAVVAVFSIAAVAAGAADALANGRPVIHQNGLLLVLLAVSAAVALAGTRTQRKLTSVLRVQLLPEQRSRRRRSRRSKPTRSDLLPKFTKL